MANDPTVQLRKFLESESPEVAKLLDGKSDNAQVQKIVAYIDALTQYVTLTEAKASVNRNNSSHYTAQKVDADNYTFQPTYDNRTIQQEKTEVLIPRESCYYLLSKRLRVNSAQIGAIDLEGKRVLIQSVWIDVTEHELTRLNEYLNLDFS